MKTETMLSASRSGIERRAPGVSRSTVAWSGLVAAALTMTACSTPPSPHSHTLMPLDVPASAAGVDPRAARIAIVLEPVRIPAQVDQPQWLVRLADGGIVPLEQERWASPLRDELHAAILERLVDRYGATESRAAPGEPPAVRIAIRLRRFDSIVGREVRLEGSTTMGRAGNDITCEWMISEPAGSGYAALDPAQQRAVARLSDSLGEDMRRVVSGQGPACTIPGRG